MPCLTRTERCEQDLMELWVYIAQDNPAAADRVLDETICLLIIHALVLSARTSVPIFAIFPRSGKGVRDRL